MNQHIKDLLGTYHDGELRGRQLRLVEDHLAQCQTCRTELDGLRALSALLQKSPPASGLMSPDRFASQVGLRLPRRPVRPAWRRALETGWQLAPLGLFGILSFVQAAFIVAGVLMIARQLGLGNDMLTGWLPAPQGGTWLNELYGLSGIGLDDFGRIALGMLEGGGPFGWGAVLYLGLLFLIGLLYWSWLASWRVRQGEN